MSVFLVATRKLTGPHYRTVYYREMLDGRARYGGKCDATRFTGPGADVVADQLRSLYPLGSFFVMLADSKPPRLAPGEVQPVTDPEQFEASL